MGGLRFFGLAVLVLGAAACSESARTVASYPIDTFGELGTPTKLTVPSAFTGMAIDPRGRFAYLYGNGSSTLMAFTINRSTFAWTAATNTTLPSAITAVTIDPSSTFAYFVLGSRAVMRGLPIEATGEAVLLETLLTASGTDDLLGIHTTEIVR